MKLNRIKTVLVERDKSQQWLAEQIGKSFSAYQAQGQFGKRHIHTLPADSIPAFDDDNHQHIELVNKTKSLISSLNENIPSSKLDPNNGPVATRRKAINKILTSLPEYEDYEELCMKIITEQSI